MNDWKSQLSLAMARQERGDTAGAEKIYHRILQLKPDCSDAYYLLGTLAQAQKSYQSALNYYQKALSYAEKPDYYRQMGHTLRHLGEFEAALQAYQNQLKLMPSSSGFLNLGRFYKYLGRVAEAQTYFNQALQLAPENPWPSYELGQLAQESEAFDAMEIAFIQAERQAKNAPSVLGALGRSWQSQGQWQKSEKLYLAWCQWEANNASAWQTLGDFYLSQRDGPKAQGAFEKALNLNPLPENQLGLAKAHLETGDQATSKEILLRLEPAKTLSPLYDLIWAELYLNQGNWRKAALAYQKGFEKKWGPPLNQVKKLPPLNPESRVINVSQHKWQHDREQIAWLLANQTLPPPLLALAQDLDKIFSQPQNLVHPSPSLLYWQKSLFFYPSCPGLETGALNPNLDYAALEAKYFENQPGILWFDDFLQPEALKALVSFCRCATIWRDYYGKSAYLGAYLDDGLHQALILQLTTELAQAFPRIFAGKTLSYGWVFKYATHSPGIRLHADQAQINVNFWLTEDQANLSPNASGLAIFDQEAPLDWDFKQYNSIEGARQAEYWLKKRNSKCLHIPYRQNRVVIFNSNLFHQTDTLQFKSGYENRRMNMTLLFGKRGHR